MQKNHLWQGEWIDTDELKLRVTHIDRYTNTVLGKNFPLEYFLDIAQKFYENLQKKDSFYERLLDLVIKTNSISKDKAKSMLDMLISFLNKKNLQIKLKSELGSQNPFELKKKSYKQDFFEAWAPMGIIVHIAPTNVFTVGVLCVIEGLLAGNINILKTSSSQQMFSQIFFEEFLKFDTKNLLKPYIIIAEVSSKQEDLLALLIKNVDIVSAWGSEEAIKSVRNMTPQGTRFVEWGHKISFAYFSEDELDNENAMREVCKDICLLDQNACSSPQNIFIQSDDFDKLKYFAKTFSKILNEVSNQSKRTDIDDAIQAEISTIINIAKMEEALNLTRVIQAKDFSWCVIADKRKGLSVSPLFRTIIIKPLPKNEIISMLRPMKNYLQTVALVAKDEKIYELTKLLLGAGCLRIKSAGHMHDNYLGEPHDGVYALPNFMKRISLDLPNQLKGISTFGHFDKPYKQDLEKYKIMDKKQFQSMIVEDKYIDLTFKSGGSSGKTTYSYYTYEDYHRVLQESAKGLFSAGLNPKTDKVLNMFAAGQLYGGFISFWTILEYLEVPQYPMGIVDDLKGVGKFIVEKKINTLLTAPSLIMSIFEQNKELFKKHSVIKKIFFGGDHFSKKQIEYLKDEFGVELIKAAAYGSNDAGPLGYQCSHCKANDYHLLEKVLTLEVFDTIDDRLIDDGDMGRLVFTSKQRDGQKIIRYDLGDLGYKHNATCKCGRQDTKFTLLGRSSDAFKAGGPFLHFNTFVKLLEDGFDYKGLVQIVLDESENKQKLLLRVENSIKVSEKDIKNHILKNSVETKFSIEELGTIFEIQIVSDTNFEVVPHSGKVKHIIDKRILS